MLDVDTYDAAEAVAADQLSNRIVQAFYPEMFQTLGYPMRVKSNNQLWRYIDVMHETRTHFNMEVLLKGLAIEEFALYKRVVELVDRYATKHFGMRAHPTPALLRALHALRLIKIVSGDARPTVLEVGPGCGYLAVLLVMEGYPYIGTDVAQAFYLYQNHMLAQIAPKLTELATEEDDVLTVAQPKPGTAIHIPWWKWITLSPERIKLSAGIMTCNHALCEMHTHSMAYLAVVGRRMLSNFPGGGKFVFENWGYDLLHSHDSVAQKFAANGLRVCHDEYAATAMVLAEEFERWSAPPTAPAAEVTPAVSASEPPPQVIGQQSSWRSSMRQHASAALDVSPTLKRFATAAYSRIKRPPHRGPAPITKPVVDRAVKTLLPAKTFPLSRRISEELAAIIARATVQESDLETFLDSYFGGKVPRLADEIFLDIIGTRF